MRIPLWCLAGFAVAFSGPSRAAETVHAAAAGATEAALRAEAKQLQVGPGLTLGIWAAEPQFRNPVAFSLVPLPPAATNAPIGVAAFIAETHRYGTSVIDITQNTPWLLHDLSLRSVTDRAELLSRRFATNLDLLTRDSEIVRRVADADGDHRAEASSVFAEGFQSSTDGTAAGVLARGTNVWFANIPHLWRLGGDPASPSPATSRSALAAGFGVHIGVTGHDLHGLALGPDGRIYLSFGDRGVRIDTREGSRIDLPDTGGVLRCEPDGGQLEVFCFGLRNPQELAFDDRGQLFTSDNDTAGADDCRVLHLVEGMDYGWRASYQHMRGFGPWVREGLWAGGLDGVPPPAGKVSQGPAGLAWYPGTGFGDRFRGRFLHADFPGGVWSFGLTRRGASFAVADPRKVLWNCWPTDVDFGPDGALYVLDWVAGWGVPEKGRIYRLVPADPLPADEAKLVAETGRLLAGHWSTQPEERLLALLGHPDRRVRLEAQFELASRGAVSFRGLRGVAFSAESTLPRLHALWAIGQIARTYEIGRATGDFSDELASLLRLMDDADEDVAGTTARVLTDAALVHADLPVAALLGEPSPHLRREAAMALGSLIGQSFRASATLPQKASRWLEEHLPRAGRLASRYVDQSVAFHPGWDSMRDFARTNTQDDPFLRHAAARHFARLEKQEATWPSYRGLSGGLRRGIEDPSPAVRRVTLLALRRLTNSAASLLLDDPDPVIAVEAARAIHDQPIPEALPQLAARLRSQPGWERIPAVTLASLRPPAAGVVSPTNTSTLQEQFLRRVLDAHFRLGGPDHATALAAFAAMPATNAAPRAGRLEALFLLGRWEVLPAEPGQVPATILPDPNHGAVPSINPENWPGWFDRIVGLWRPLPPRPADDASRAFAPHADRLVAEADAEVAAAAIDTVVRLRIKESGPALLARFRQPETPARLRRVIPAGLATLESPLAAEATRLALQDSDAGVRAAAVPLTGSIPAADAIPLLLRLIEEGSRQPAALPLAQAAVMALGHRPEPQAAEPVDRLLAQLVAGQLPRELELEVREAAHESPDPGLRERLRAWETTRPPGDPVADGSDALYGGDATRGRGVFFEKVEVQCSRCHRVRGEGGIVGPALDGVARRLDRAGLLESVLRPNARIAAGFENAALTLTDGREISGTIREETADSLLVVSGEDGEQRIPRSQVARRQRGLSAMPEGLATALTRRELRDVVAYLATLTD